VEIVGFGYNPSPVVVTVGDSVRWTNHDSIDHTATAFDNSWTTATLFLDDAGTVAFPTAGNYQYYCLVHGFSMQGLVRVVEAPAATVPESPLSILFQVTAAASGVGWFLLRRNRRGPALHLRASNQNNTK
jgi:hypothetical protein